METSKIFESSITTTPYTALSSSPLTDQYTYRKLLLTVPIYMFLGCGYQTRTNIIDTGRNTKMKSV